MTKGLPELIAMAERDAQAHLDEASRAAIHGNQNTESQHRTLARVHHWFAVEMKKILDTAALREAANEQAPHEYTRTDSEAAAWREIAKRSDEAHAYCHVNDLLIGQNIWHAVLDDAIQLRAAAVASPPATTSDYCRSCDHTHLVASPCWFAASPPETAPASDLEAVAAEIEKSLAWMERATFVVDYSKIGRGAGGLATCVTHSDAMHALLFVRKALRAAHGSRPTETPEQWRAALLALRDEMQTRGPYGLSYATVAERLTAILERP